MRSILATIVAALVFSAPAYAYPPPNQIDPTYPYPPGNHGPPLAPYPPPGATSDQECVNGQHGNPDPGDWCTYTAPNGLKYYEGGGAYWSNQ
jgi:hypothetical protein